MGEKEFWLIFFQDGKVQVSDTPVSLDAVFYGQGETDIEPKKIDSVVHVVEYSQPTNYQLRKERDEYKRLAESWMADYDKLKAKYEPTVAVLS